MAQATFADGSTPEVIEVARVATILFSGGQGTAARFLGNMMRFIAEESALQGLLRTARDRIPNFVEETLRMFSPVKTSFRMARHRATLGGTKIPAGSTLLLLLGAADRDEHRFECPGEFAWTEPTRASTSPSAGVFIRARARLWLEPTVGSPSNGCSIASATSRSQRPGLAPRPRGATNTPRPISFRGVEALHLEFAPT
jgi:hypothetical protein